MFDACYSGAAVGELMPQSDVASRMEAQAVDAMSSGTALLCASSAADVALAPVGGQFTMFTDGVLSALKEGSSSCSARLSMDDVRTLAERTVRTKYRDLAVNPEIHIPDQRKGDISGIPFFPNPAIRPSLDARVDEIEVHLADIAANIASIGEKIGVVGALGPTVRFIPQASHYLSLAKNILRDGRIFQALGAIVAGGVILYSLLALVHIIWMTKIGHPPFAVSNTSDAIFFLLFHKTVLAVLSAVTITLACLIYAYARFIVKYDTILIGSVNPDDENVIPIYYEAYSDPSSFVRGTRRQHLSVVLFLVIACVFSVGVFALVASISSVTYVTYPK